MSPPVFKVGEKATRYYLGERLVPAVTSVTTVARITPKRVRTEDGKEWKAHGDEWIGATFATSGYLRPWRPEDDAAVKLASLRADRRAAEGRRANAERLVPSRERDVTEAQQRLDDARAQVEREAAEVARLDGEIAAMGGGA